MKPDLSRFLMKVVLVCTILGSSLAFVSKERVNKELSGTTQDDRRKDPFTSTWTQIKINPPDFVQVDAGSRVELHCDVIGNPTPQVLWLNDDELPSKFDEERMNSLEESDNAPPERSKWESISELSSTYVIDCVQPEDEGVKYCVSMSKNVMIQSPGTALVVNDRPHKCSSISEPTITLYAHWRLALQRTTVILPCRVTGQPMPNQYWQDNNGRNITTITHDRHKVLPNGDLEITNLQWKDMGRYFCYVYAGNVRKIAKTFVYPTFAAPEENDSLEENFI